MKLPRSVLTSDRGFGIAESAVALFLIFVVLVALTRTLDSGLRVAGETRRETQAQELVVELLERVQSMSFDTVALTSDAQSTSCTQDLAKSPPDVAGVGCATWASALGIDTLNWEFEGQDLVFADPTTVLPPLHAFHDTVTRDAVDYERYVLVTSVPDTVDPTVEAFRKVTAIVRWTASNARTRDVRQVVLLTSFKEPPANPLISGSIDFTGGLFTVEGYLPDLVDPDLTLPADLDGSNPLAPRPNIISATAALPSAHVDATRDTIWGASVDVTASGVDVEWNVPDPLDPTVNLKHTVDGGSFHKEGDSDPGTPIPENDGPTENQLSPTALGAVTLAEAAPYDLHFRSLDDSATVPMGSVASGEAWSTYEPVPGLGDELPYATMTYTSADLLRWTHPEYAGVHLYDVFQYGMDPGPAVTFSGTANREGDLITNRRVDVTADWEGGTVGLLVADGITAPQYVGHFKIEMPKVTATLSAGKGVFSVPTLTSNNGEPYRVKVWWWKDNNYKLLVDEEYALVTDTIRIMVDDGDPRVESDLDKALKTNPWKWEYKKPAIPKTRFHVRGEIFINPVRKIRKTEFGGETITARVEAESIVDGWLEYWAEDRDNGDLVMWDYKVEFTLGGFVAKAIYEVPE